LPNHLPILEALVVNLGKEKKEERRIAWEAYQLLIESNG
jgi:hypothetical protein